MSSRRALVVLAVALLVAVLWTAATWRHSDGPAVSTLQRGLSSDPESLDPQKARTVQAGQVLHDIGEGLMSYSPAGELVGGAAQSWTVGDDGLRYAFVLRENARWSNGDALTAEHFAYSLRRLVDPATGASYGDLLANVVNAAAIIDGDKSPATLGVEAIDDRTLVVRLERPTPYLLNLLAHFVTFPVHPAKVAALGDRYGRAGVTPSNGAYVLDARSPGSVITLRRNPYYWNDAATAIDRVRYHVIENERTEYSRYQADELHITDNVPPNVIRNTPEELSGQLHVAPYLGVYFYGLNLTRPPFRDNPQLRQALSMAIDRDVLVTSITGRGELPAYGWVSPGVANYESQRQSYADLTREQRHDEARRLYRAAGYGPDNPLRTEIRYNTSATEGLVVQAVIAMWKEVLGVETTAVNEEIKTLLIEIREAKVTQVFRGSWIGDYNDAYTFLGIMESGNPLNMPHYTSDEYNSLMRSAAAQTDPRHRRRFLEEAERVLLADHAVIPLYFYVSKHLIKPGVRGWEDNVLDYHYSQHLRLVPADAEPR